MLSPTLEKIREFSKSDSTSLSDSTFSSHFSWVLYWIIPDEELATPRYLSQLLDEVINIVSSTSLIYDFNPPQCVRVNQSIQVSMWVSSNPHLIWILLDILVKFCSKYCCTIQTIDSTGEYLLIQASKILPEYFSSPDFRHLARVWIRKGSFNLNRDPHNPSEIFSGKWLAPSNDGVISHQQFNFFLSKVINQSLSEPLNSSISIPILLPSQLYTLSHHFQILHRILISALEDYKSLQNTHLIKKVFQSQDRWIAASVTIRRDVYESIQHLAPYIPSGIVDSPLWKLLNPLQTFISLFVTFSSFNYFQSDNYFFHPNQITSYVDPNDQNSSVLSDYNPLLQPLNKALTGSTLTEFALRPSDESLEDDQTWEWIDLFSSAIEEDKSISSHSIRMIFLPKPLSPIYSPRIDFK